VVCFLFRYLFHFDKILSKMIGFMPGGEISTNFILTIFQVVGHA